MGRGQLWVPRRTCEIVAKVQGHVSSGNRYYGSRDVEGEGRPSRSTHCITTIRDEGTSHCIWHILHSNKPNISRTTLQQHLFFYLCARNNQEAYHPVPHCSLRLPGSILTQETSTRLLSCLSGQNQTLPVKNPSKISTRPNSLRPSSTG